MLPITQVPYPSFFDLDGSPLDEGSVYYGVINTNPVTNPLPIFWDVDGLEPAPQPVRTINGFPYRSGTPSNVYADDPYSISVYDKKGRLIYTHPDSSEYNQLPAFMDDIASLTNSAKGAAMVGYLPPWLGAVGQTVSERLQQRVSIKEFGVKTTNTGAQNSTAIAVALAYASAQGGLTLHFPRGTFDFDSTIDISGIDSLRIVGDGMDATILRITNATVDFIASHGTSSYQAIENLTLTSSVTRTGGSMFTAGSGGGLWKRALMHRVRITQHINGVVLNGFEICTLSEVYIVDPSGAGTAIVCGEPSAFNRGAGLNLIDLFLRGNNDVTQNAPTGLIGILIYDIEAVFGFNFDAGQFVNQVMAVTPTFAARNCYFVQCFFDGTKMGDNVLFDGAGVKERFQFTGTWFNGAGALTGGNVDAAGVNFGGVGAYSDVKFDACRFISTQGPAVIATSPTFDAEFGTCTFNNCASASVTFPYTVYIAPVSAQTNWAKFTGAKFISSANADFDFFCGTNSRNTSINSTDTQKGLTYELGATFGNCAGNFDGTSDAIASADPLLVSPLKNFYNVTGGTAIGTIPRTYTGHSLVLVTDASLTFSDSASLHLAGNFVTANGSVLTIICEPAGGGWREQARTNT